MRSHLLVPVDFSGPSKQMVASLERFVTGQSQRVTLLHVRPPSMGIVESPEDGVHARGLLEEQADELRAQGWQVEPRMEEGRPGSTIIDVADEVGAELIVLANRGHSAITEVLLGSTAVDVLERSKLPVFLFCADASSQPLWDRIVHPTDLSKPADRALKWAQELAVEASLPLVLLHSVDDRFSGQTEVEKKRRQLEKLKGELRSQGVGTVEVQVVEGPPKKMVVEAGDHYPGALFVMGTQGRGWLGDLMLGGVSRAMARQGGHHLLLVP